MEVWEMKVLIADDEPITRMDLHETLEKEGYDVIAEAADGFDAVELCRKLHPDLVIMDVKMPLMDGMTASSIITQERLAETVVLLTAYSDQEFIQAAKKSGVSGYLVKPVDERSFIPALEIAVARSQELQKLQKDYDAIARRLESRTVVEQAKGIIMKQNGLTEQEAYDYIRGISKSKNIAMKRVAEMILKQKGE
ncbi:MAG TPA: response regulator [Candidatus Blautia gallistercoris]|uniref:Stage 0 sporulation protein A homolog n=1 Tax=Candidatus Blautia gallistercoris TaxID=2838490 RepID=A0A9D1WFT5_9FIRM|nr:response regulator [Candidatus Blautia gallistercoris]